MRRLAAAFYGGSLLPPFYNGVMPEWPHRPAHRLSAAGAYIVTSGTYLKKNLFNTPEKLQLLHDRLLELAALYDWKLQAWAILANHYHFVGLAPEQGRSLQSLIRHLHSVTAREINSLDQTPGRKVWFQYWESHISYQRSYFARLGYVHRNAVHHNLVSDPVAYKWCSAAWFERMAETSFFRTIMDFPHDRLDLADDY